jgi:hypothetical protein
MSTDDGEQLVLEGRVLEHVETTKRQRLQELVRRYVHSSLWTDDIRALAKSDVVTVRSRHFVPSSG